MLVVVNKNGRQNKTNRKKEGDTYFDYIKNSLYTKKLT